MAEFDLDLSPTITGLNNTAAAARTASKEFQAAAEAGKGAFVAAAQAAVEAKNRINEQNEAVRQAASVQRELAGVLSDLRQRERELNTAQSKSGGYDEQKRISAALKQNAAEQAKVRAEIKLNKAALEEERVVLSGIKTDIQQQANAQKLATAATKDAAVATKQQAAASSQSAEATGKAGGAASGLVGYLQRGLAIGAAFFSIGKIVEFKDAIVEASETLGILRARLTTAFNGDSGKARAALIQISDFAAKAGIDVNELGNSYATLVSRGIIPTATQLRQLGDVAATSGKQASQFIEAILDAQTGENERLKEFGITAQTSGNKVAFSFRGVTTEVAKTKDAITDYLFSLGDLEGVQGAAVQLAGEAAGENIKLADSFVELFRVLGEKTGPAFNFFTRNLRALTQQVTESLKSNEQKATESAVRQTDALTSAAQKRFQQVAQQAKTSGKDIQRSLEAVYGKMVVEDQRAVLEAQTKLDEFNRRPDPSLSSGREGGTDIAVRRIQRESKALENQLALAKARQQANETAYKQNQKALTVEADQLGVIAALREKIKKEQEDLNNLKDVPGFESARKALVAQIALDEKELDRLLGKVEKKAKTIDKLTGALRALEAERLKLLKEYDQAELNSLKDQGQAKAAEQLRQDNAAIDRLEQSLKDREAAVRKAGGRGSNADGVIDSVQAQQLQERRRLALEQFNEELSRIGREYAAKSLELQRDSDEKEIAQLRAKFAEELRIAESANEALGTAIERAAKDGNEVLTLSLGASKLVSDQLLKDLRAAAQEQEGLLRRQQALNAIDRDERARIEGINTGNGVPAEQFTDVTVDQSATATNGAAERLNFLQRLYRRATAMEVDLEKERRKAVLKAQIETNDARLIQYQNDFTEQGQEIQRGLKAQNKQYLDELGNLRDETQKNAFSFYKLLLGKNDTEENREILDQSVSQIKGALDQIVQANLQATQLVVDARQRDLDDLQSKLLGEIALRKEGAASNVQAALDEIKAARQARNEALKEQRAAQKQQAIINGLSQISSIASASAKIIEGWSSVPFIGSLLGIAAVGAMIAAFTISQSKAKKAIESSAPNGSFFKGGLAESRGGYTGHGSPHEESNALGSKSYTYHKKEFVMRHDLTDEHFQFFDALHRDKLGSLSWQDPTLRKIKAEVQLDPELPGKLLHAKAEAQRLVIEHQFKPLQDQFHASQKELVAMRKQLEMMPKKIVIPMTENGLTLVYDIETNTTNVKRLS